MRFRNSLMWLLISLLCLVGYVALGHETMRLPFWATLIIANVYIAADK